MEDERLSAETAALIQKNWGLQAAPSEDWERFREALAAHLQHMLADDLAALVNAMYRLDVPEHQFRAAFEAGSPAEIAAELATVVLNRERLRAETRIRYRSSSSAQES